MENQERVPVGAVAEWLESTVRRAPESPARHELRAEFSSSPEPWKSLFRDVVVETIQLRSGGTARVAVSGGRVDVRRFASRLHDLGAPLVARKVLHVPPARRLLTAAQHEALRLAVDAGYYQIPRPLNLHDLAAQAGVSAAALSERLRRAEGRVLTQYVKSAAAAAADADGFVIGVQGTPPETPVDSSP